MLPVTELLQKFNIIGKNYSLYEQALTHPSYHVETEQKGPDYERLEFMGDAIISLVVAELIYRKQPHFDQGLMSKTRAKLVQTDSLFRIAKDYRLADYVKIGPSMSRDLVAASKKIMEDVFEALMGAIYIDQGFFIAKRVIKTLFAPDIECINVDELTDYKTQLQEIIQADHREAVKYIVIEEAGPAHDRRFTVAVTHDSMELGRGNGPSKKIAEQAAAKDALRKKAI